MQKRNMKCITHTCHVVSCISTKWDAHIGIWISCRQRKKTNLYYANLGIKEDFSILEEPYKLVWNFNEMKVNNVIYQINIFNNFNRENNYKSLCFWSDKIKNSKRKFQDSLQSLFQI